MAFQARAATTGNARSPSVARRVTRTISDDDEDDRRRRRDWIDVRHSLKTVSEVVRSIAVQTLSCCWFVLFRVRATESCVVRAEELSRFTELDMTHRYTDNRAEPRITIHSDLRPSYTVPMLSPPTQFTDGAPTSGFYLSTRLPTSECLSSADPVSPSLP